MKQISVLITLVALQVSLFAQRTENYIQYVNPLIGTRKMGHTYPGATVPFGAVQQA